ncbi:MAG TPA: TrmH family RNA methyltransferase [Thermosulfurimonas dismutans]|uniref:TrmH family RNA methyltransferase n=1 Tax=Thermosulfurimonas dismutans TaxID=999894 RepID=A0A7C3CYP9_9BACT|nr:TrmH family RNA methyltransferase [Thermosulfurimonas dismutans]
MAVKARFYRCEGCGLRFPALEEVGKCPACGGGVVRGGERGLETDAEHPSEPLFPPCSAVLENLRSAWNVGSIFRTADAAGWSHLHLCGITPAPPHPGISKTALGAERCVSWSYHPDAVEVIERLRKEGWTVWVLETGGEPWHPEDPIPEGPFTLVVGNELAGVDPEILSLAHRVVELPMRGCKRSLNVSVAFGVLALGISLRRLTPR